MSYLGPAVVGVQENEPSSLMLQVSTNPSRSGMLEVDFRLATTSPAALELLDIAGRRLTLHEVESNGPGNHSILLRVGRHLSSGVYFIRLHQGAALRTVRTVILD